MDLRPILYINGLFLMILSLGMVFPMIADLYTHSADWQVFFSCIIITAFFGGSLVLSNSGQHYDLNLRQAFLLTVTSWLSIASFSALPFYLSGLQLGVADSFFEAMSGITTTGSTVITSLKTTPKGLLLWRAILQWFGGIGFIVMAMSMLPMLKIGGMRLFKTESSENEKALPRAAQLASAIGLVYVWLTLLCALAYIAAGLGLFDAVVHAMTTLSTGGFSTFDTSLSGFDAPWVEIVATIFMILGGLPFVLYIKALRGNIKPLFKDTQVQWFLTVVTVATLALVFYLVIHYGASFGEAIRYTLFNVVSIITTTGFVSSDYSAWGGFAFSVMFLLTFIGACAGSTSGGTKIFRSKVLFAVTSIQIKRLLHPNGVFIPHYNGQPIPQDVPMSVMSFFFVYIIVFVLGGVVLSYIGLDFITAFSGSATAISNVGPGFGDIIGPTGTFAALPDSAKWVLSFLMLMGRLELFTVLVILSPHFWED